MASEPSSLSYEDLKAMLSSFRVPELQALLSSCGRCRTGRKGELLSRAFNLIRPAHENSLSRKAKSRIIELYRLRYPNSIPLDNYDHPPSGASLTALSGGYSKDDKAFTSPVHNPTMGSKAYMNSPPRLSISKSTSAVPIHPDVRFRRLPFQELVDVLVKPTSLVQKSITGYQQMQLSFHLTPHQVQLISHARSYTIQSKVEYSVQVVLRFCLAETSCSQEDLFPPRCTISVNGRSCLLPGQLPTGNQHVEPKKPHRPANLTHLCRLSPMTAEQIRINWLPSDMGQRYTATVELVKLISSSALVQKLKTKAERNADHSRALIKEKLAHDPDSEIATTSLKVSLCCPIGRTKMSLPCRSSTCTHVQCFDAVLYIQMNEKKPSWICPVCDQRAYCDQLVVDGLFSEILRSSPDADEIVFFQDGSWKPLSDVNDQNSKPVHRSADTINVLPGTPDTGNSKDSQADKRNDVIVIDLLSDSSDEEEEYNNAVGASSSSGMHINASHLPRPPPLVSSRGNDEADGTSQRARGPRFRHVPTIPPSESGIQLPNYYSQSLHDLYSILPPADRLAAALYLDQAGLLSNPGSSSSSDIISLD